MDLTTIKDRIDEETFTKLEEYISDLTGQRDAARKESIDGRKKLKEQVASLTRTKQALYDHLGLDDDADLDALPDVKGYAEAAKVVEQKMKRLQKELDDKNSALEATAKKYRDSQQSAAVAKALAGQEWLDRDLAEVMVTSKLVWEDDQLYFQHENQLLGLDDGVKSLIKAKPALLKSSGAGGSGYQPNGAAGKVANPWMKETFNLTQQGKILRENPQLAEQFRTAAAT